MRGGSRRRAAGASRICRSSVQLRRGGRLPYLDFVMGHVGALEFPAIAVCGPLAPKIANRNLALFIAGVKIGRYTRLPYAKKFFNFMAPSLP
jgi:hypothetical protein